jgi:hypothetical protein
VLPLANFGGLTFVATKAPAAGHAGTISDPAWSATAITLGDPNSGTTNATPTASQVLCQHKQRFRVSR